MKSCSTKGLGYALAKRRVTNEKLNTFVDTNDEWISSRTGIRARYISEEGNTNNLGAHTTHIAVGKSGIDPREIDLIITATSTPDQTTPSTACLVQEKLGLNNQHMMTFDLSATCSDFLYTLQNTHVILAAGQVTCALIIGAEVISKQLDRNDRSTCIIFADRTGAAIVKQEDTGKRMLHFAGGMGDTTGVIHSDAPKPRPLFSEQPYQPPVICVEGNATFRFAMKAIQGAIEDVLKQTGERVEDIDQIVPYQTNVRTINSVCKRIHIDKEHIYISTEEYGNTSAANIPLAPGETSEKGLLQPGMKIALNGFDTGFAWAGCYIEL